MFDFDKVDFNYIRQVLTFCKDVPEAYLEPSRTSASTFCDFLKKAPP